MKTVRQITILGSTGSIGESTLDVIARHPDRFRAFALTANQNVEKMLLAMPTLPAALCGNAG